MLQNSTSHVSLKTKLLLFLIIVTFAILWIQTANKDTVSKELLRKKRFKYVLLWTDFAWAPFFNPVHGREPFIRNNCTFTNCYVTKDRKLLKDITEYDAIFFNGNHVSDRIIAFPEKRSPQQKYVFFNLESGDNYPVCGKIYDEFFNWTSTFLLDSDVPYPYIMIRDINGKIVGPKRNMNWVEKMQEVDEDLIRRFQNKTKAAAWFVSNCQDKTGRHDYVEELEKALAIYRLAVDVYGKCGPLKCGNDDNCTAILKRDYYFFMSMENSFSVDYVTEKVLTALNNDAVPIVLGGANYTWFLPPGSYIDARSYQPKKLAAFMNRLINSPKQYSEYFRWKYHYTYHDPKFKENVCSICEIFNDKTKLETRSSYKNFREWWNPNYEKICDGVQLIRYKNRNNFYIDYDKVEPEISDAIVDLSVI